MVAAYLSARKARKRSFEAFAFDREREARLDSILASLRDRSYVHGPYREIVLRDSKKRYVFSPRLEDHAVHHLLHKRVYETLDAKMVGSTFACRIGGGHHKAIRYLADLVRSEAAKNPDEPLYYLKADLSKYFFSIPHDRLMAKLGKRFKDGEVLWLAERIVSGYVSPPYYDGLLASAPWYVENPRKGLPIGGILSQLFANFYLNDVDQYLKHVLKARFVRYMDDFVILGTSRRLKEIREPFFAKLREEGLVLHPKKVSFHSVSGGLRFVGYRVTPDGKRVARHAFPQGIHRRPRISPRGIPRKRFRRLFRQRQERTLLGAPFRYRRRRVRRIRPRRPAGRRARRVGRRRTDVRIFRPLPQRLRRATEPASPKRGGLFLPARRSDRRESALRSPRFRIGWPTDS